jgi:hypothetical protein
LPAVWGDGPVIPTSRRRITRLTWISCGLTSRLTWLRWLAKYLAKGAKYANCLFSALSNCISKCNPAGKKMKR